MLASTMIQRRMRSRTLSGWPKKNAAWLSSENRKCGSRPGTVSTCQARNSSTRRTSCQARRLRRLGLIKRHVAFTASCLRELLLVAGEHLFAQHVPDRLVQLDEARIGAHLGDVARAREVDAELADDARTRARGQDDDAVAHRDRLVEVVRDEQHRLATAGRPCLARAGGTAPQREHLVFHQ